MDQAVARLLRVQPQRPDLRGAVATATSQAFQTPLLVSALRCILRYIVLPFVLPLLGVATSATLGIVTGAALGIILILDVIAVIAIVATVRRCGGSNIPAAGSTCRWRWRWRRWSASSS